MTHGMGRAGLGQGKAPQVHRDTPRIWGGYDHELNDLINESTLATFQSSLGCWLLLSGEILELFHFLKEPFPSTLGGSKTVPFPTVTLEREFQEFTKGPWGNSQSPWLRHEVSSIPPICGNLQILPLLLLFFSGSHSL